MRAHALVFLQLTYAWDDVEEVVDLLVDSRGDDFDLRESIGHRVDSHLCHQQGHQQDLVFLNVVVLNRNRQRIKTRTKRDCLQISGQWGSPYQQNADSHHGSGSGGHGAVHQNDVIFADVFRQTEVVELKGVADRMLVDPNIKTAEYKTTLMWHIIREKASNKNRLPYLAECFNGF